MGPVLTQTPLNIFSDLDHPLLTKKFRIFTIYSFVRALIVFLFLNTDHKLGCVCSASLELFLLCTDLYSDHFHIVPQKLFNCQNRVTEW